YTNYAYRLGRPRCTPVFRAQRLSHHGNPPQVEGALRKEPPTCFACISPVLCPSRFTYFSIILSRVGAGGGPQHSTSSPDVRVARSIPDELLHVFARMGGCD